MLGSLQKVAPLRHVAKSTKEKKLAPYNQKGKGKVFFAKRREKKQT